MKNRKRCHFIQPHFLLAVLIIGFAMTACRDSEPSTPKLTGTVSISGTAAIGETLIADTDSLKGKGGLSFIWTRGGAVPIGDNSGSYVVQSADLDSTIIVTVTRSGYSGKVSSEPTAAVTLPPLGGTVIIEGIAEVGHTLTANTTSLGGTGEISYQWKRGGTVNVGGNSTYVVREADPGHTLTVTVTRVGYLGSQTSNPTATVLSRLSGTVTISGTAAVGETLTADTSSLGNTGTVTYQWVRDGIIIGTDSTYVIQDADLGSTITVTVTGTGFTGTFTSEPTDAVALPLLTGTVFTTGTPQVGLMLTAYTNLGGSGDVSYQWKRNSTNDGTTTNIGANSNTYTIQAADVDYKITVTVTRSGNSGGVTSEPTAAVFFPPLTGSVSISGTAQSGQTLTANANLGGTGTISYQWKRGGTVIIGTNSSTYLIQTTDAGYTITVTVTREGYSGSFTSNPTAVIILPPLSGTVTITGTAAAGQTLTANTTNLVGTGTITYQWKRGTGNIGTNSNTYTLQNADADYSITVTVTRVGYSGSVTSNAVSFGRRTYAETVKKVNFTGPTATVTFTDLASNNVYLVKVNTSTSNVAAADTGSVQSIAPSFSMIDDVEPPVPFNFARPYRHHPDAAAFNANPPHIDRETIGPRADIIPPRMAVVGDTKTFWIQQNFISGTWIQVSTTLLAAGQYGNIWVYNNQITTAEAQALAAKFDIIYPAETNILGYEFGGGPGGSGGKDGDPKIQILVYPAAGSTVIGYFWGKDYYDNQTGTNKAEIFYLNASYMKNNPSLLYLTLAHEFQHMINFNRKFVQSSRNSSAWYDETLSMMTEDVMADIIGVPSTNASHPIRDHIPGFLNTYDQVGFSEWPDSPYPYSKGYTFGAYLLRNYGGADILKRILANNTVDATSITTALNEVETGMTYVKAISRFGEAMILSGASKPEGGHTFDKPVTTTITGNNGTHTYTLPAFDIWTIGRPNYTSATKGPVVYSTAQRTMIGHTVLVQQGTNWSNRTGTFSITLNKPSSDSIEMYLIVR